MKTNIDGRQRQSHVTKSPARASRIRPELSTCSHVVVDAGTRIPIHVHHCRRFFLAQTAVALQVDRLVSGGIVTTLARIVGSVGELVRK